METTTSEGIMKAIHYHENQVISLKQLLRTVLKQEMYAKERERVKTKNKVARNTDS